MAATDTQDISLLYFNTTGRGLAIRLALEIGGISYENKFVENWAEEKTATPWGSVPLLKVDGVEVGQTRSILRYVGKLSGLYPTEEVLSAHVDTVLDVCEEILVTMFKEDREAQFSAEGSMGVRLNQFCSFLKSVGNGQYAVGDSLTLADLAIYSYFNLTSCWFETVNTWKMAPQLLDIRETVEKLPAVQAHLGNEELTGERYDYCRRTSASLREEYCPVKLTYWHGYGRAERLRMALVLGGISFQDIGLETSEQMEELRKSKLKYGQLPLVEMDGKCLVQTLSTLRYIARKGNVYGDSDEEKYEIDNICDALSDFYDSNMFIIFTDDEGAAKLKTKFLDVTCPKLLPIFEAQVAQNPSGWFVGSRVSVADGFFFAACRYMSLPETIGNLDFLQQYPALRALYDNVAALPSVAAYVETEQKLPIDQYVTNVRNSLQWFA